jgi:hypothetical protein
MEFALLWCPLPAMDHKTYPKHGYIGLFKRAFGAIFNTHPQHGYIGLFKRGFGAIFNTHPNTGILGCSKEVLVQF